MFYSLLASESFFFMDGQLVISGTPITNLTTAKKILKTTIYNKILNNINQKKIKIIMASLHYCKNKISHIRVIVSTADTTLTSNHFVSSNSLTLPMHEDVPCTRMMEPRGMHGATCMPSNTLMQFQQFTYLKILFTMSLFVVKLHHPNYASFS